MGVPLTLTVQIHVRGAWRDAARLTVMDPDAGRHGRSWLEYEVNYVLEVDPDVSGDLRGYGALSVGVPASMEIRSFPQWPPVLLDFLPQGHGRRVLAETLELSVDSPSCDTSLLLRAGGGPIGNIRIKEAWEAERDRLAGRSHPVA